MTRATAWKAYLGAGLALTLLFALVPPFKSNGPVMNVLGLSPVVAIVVGMRLHRPAAPGAWAFCAAGLALFWLGDLYTIGYPRLTGHDVPFPSVGDAAYVLVYPVLMAGLLVLVRRRNPHRDRTGLVDSLIITIGLALLSWVFLIAPYLHDPMDVLGKLTSVAYPIGDILLLAAVVRLAVDAGSRAPAFHLLTASIVALLITDFAYGIVTRAGAYDDQVVLDLGWIAFYLLWGAAALHPSMAGLGRPGRPTTQQLSRVRLAMLTAASLMAPALLFVELGNDSDVDTTVIIGSAVALFVLVLLRMTGLIRERERVASRERLLSGAGKALVAASTDAEMAAALAQGAHALAGDGACVQVRVAGEDGAVHAGEDAGQRERLELELLAAGEHLGALEVRTPRPLAPADVAALQALTTQVALALHSAALQREVLARRGAARFRALIQHSSDLITVVDDEGRIAYQSPSIQRLLGYAPEDVTGAKIHKLVRPQDAVRLLQLLADAPAGETRQAETLECVLQHRDGSTRHVEVLLNDLRHDEHVRGIVLNVRDVSERRAVEEQLALQAFHDPVTDLANRALFAEKVRHALARHRREQTGLAVLFLDLDDFKTINDSLGHAAGDRVLIEVAQRLSGCIRAADTAARFGGDEFAVLLEGVENPEQVADTAERIIFEVARPIGLTEKELTIRGSLGIAIVEAESLAPDADADTLIRDADAAMYIAKSDGKGTYRMFEPAMHEGVLARLEMRGDLQRALNENQFELNYQPLVLLSTGQIAGFEALLRWRHPERGVVPPGDFIPFAEESGLIVPIGRWVLREGCREAVQLNRLAAAPLHMSVNLSVKQLQHSDIVADVRDALDETGLDPRLLTLEITETMMMTDTENAIRRLHELKALGVKLAMDDFGTGYSSLSYLHRFPVDVLKMDRSFLTERTDGLIPDLASAVVAIGETLRLDVVAEGIEHATQWESLREIGCDLGQGFHFARPMDAVQAAELVQRPAVPGA